MASLLKVPIVMAVYQKIEKGELTRDTQLTLIERDIDNKFGSLWKEGAGYKISVKEAIRLVLTESDNTAKNALLRTIQVEDLANVFDYLDVPKESEDEGPVVNPKNYSSILRSLYLASYLPHNLSNEILDVMTQSVHTDRLRAGIPNEVPVAHKIGVYERAEDDLNDVFTDCGIVYATRRPYILCIMTRSSLEQAQVNMSQISRMIYDYVSTANK
jgi:beta-lactamase class A